MISDAFDISNRMEMDKKKPWIFNDFECGEKRKIQLKIVDDEYRMERTFFSHLSHILGIKKIFFTFLQLTSMIQKQFTYQERK